MDRFIERVYQRNRAEINVLKSSMDRFIEIK